MPEHALYDSFIKTLCKSLLTIYFRKALSWWTRPEKLKRKDDFKIVAKHKFDTESYDSFVE